LPTDLELDEDGDGPAPEPPPTEKRGGREARIALEWAGLAVLALLIALLIKAFLFQAFWIPSASMEPTLKINDRVLVNKLAYKLHDVRRGDIIVFSPPPGSEPGYKHLVKRVIGLPGETVSGSGGHVLINGKRLSEPYLPKGTYTSDFSPVKIAPDHYWMMGDNRGDSSDSRVFGTITKSAIVGPAFVRMWPISRIGFL
jgi:signal peptidase I